ncbi:MAG TPA: hypothetical protein VNW46_18750 [Gemmatimonadaceae bacterium]|nr:hypothetical protein [Gemmatimonadaceae bacterium]
MQRIACLTLAIVLAACGSSDTTHTGPSAFTFTGTWAGTADGDSVTVTAQQTDSIVSGTGSAFILGQSFPITVTGTSAPPNIILTGNLPCAQTVTFTGTYVSADSVTGILTQGASSFAFGLKKH